MVEEGKDYIVFNVSLNDTAKEDMCLGIDTEDGSALGKCV